MKKERNFLFSFENADSKKLMRESEKGAISAFKRAAKEVPAYKKILKEKNLKAEEIKTIEDFKKKVPTIEKKDIFTIFDLKELCVDGNFNGMRSAMTSSGFSGVFSYGVVTKDDIKNVQKMVDSLVDYFFDARKNKILIINALAMGVNFNSSFPIINTSVKSDMIIAFLKIFEKEFNCFVIVCDPHFAKKIIEDGIASGINWKNLDVSFFMGGDWFSNSFANYIKKNISTKSQVRITMGLTELGLNIFNDFRELSEIRDLCQKNEKLRTELFGNLKTAPEIMNYYPPRTFIEVINKDGNGFGELVFSMLGNLKMPLIRYNSKDIGKLFDYDEFKKILHKNGYSHLVPKLKLPIAAIWGRKTEKLRFNAQDVKEALYRNFSVAEKITGYFRISGNKIEIQLKENFKLNRKISNEIKKELSELGIKFQIDIYDYNKFPYGMNLDYESKFKCF